MEELGKQYNPKEVEDKWYAYWQEFKFFAAKVNPAKIPFTIVIPPPNVTGILHMGHALNNTIQDILIRYQRMKGKEALWMPGTDHAGIATQNVVEKSLAKEGLKRQDLGREKFIQRVWQWKEQYGSTIIRQLKKLGASCDWGRERFTMDPEYSQSVTDVFVRLWEKGLIYQGSYIINWCPRCQTALSDEEAPHQDLQGNLYYLRYPLKDTLNPKLRTPNYIIVATTRPETMLGDTAVAVNPKDKRYKGLVGKTLILPLVNREIKIIADSMVDKEFGTGAVKVTPAHDPNDYATGKKHKLEFINVMHPDARMNEFAGKYKDLDRFAAREAILNDLKEQGLLEKTEPHALSAGHCYRCHTIIEPYLSKQWFVKTKPLSKPALEAVKKGEIKFYPQRWTKVYLGWMENIQDWCISRQIWWGHRLPVYYCKDCQAVMVAKIKPDICTKCKSINIYQDEDVLDTWFSSWLWPFATFKNSQDLKYFYPTSTLVTAPEIIFFWVARMIMAGLEFKKEIPFKDVYIHGTVRDVQGKKMSKSLGNIIDPLDIINEYGADALRFSLISITSSGQDVFLSKERFEQGRNFANKIWNASRFILSNLDASQIQVDLCQFFKKDDLSIVNRWILSRFYSTFKEVDQALDSFQFNEAANLLYGFFWHEFCDWYIEIIKPEIKSRQNQIVMFKVLEKFLRLLHPFMPFISEEIWQRLPVGSGESGVRSIMIQNWPHLQKQIIDKKTEAQAISLFAMIKEIRNLCSSIEINPSQEVKISLYPHSQAKQQLAKEQTPLIMNLTKISGLEVLATANRPPATISSVVEDIDIYLHFSGLIDAEKEKAKINNKISQLVKLITAKENNLGNKDFVSHAPSEVVEKEKKAIQEYKDSLKRLEKMLNELQRNY